MHDVIFVHIFIFFCGRCQRKVLLQLFAQLINVPEVNEPKIKDSGR